MVVAVATRKKTFLLDDATERNDPIRSESVTGYWLAGTDPANSPAEPPTKAAVVAAAAPL